MTCLVCGTKFHSASQSSPRETCDCEQEVTLLALQADPDLDLPTLRALWLVRQQQEDATCR